MNRSQSIVAGEASGGIEYCQAPLAELRFIHASTRFNCPIAPALKRSRAFAYTMELTRWLPT
jgi:hypothetical protein